MSVKANRRRGSKTEIVACQWLTDNWGWRAERIALSGVLDRGDISGIPGLCCEVKSSNLERPPWREWVRQAVKEGRNTGLPWVCLYRPPRTPNPDNWLVIAPMELMPTGVDWCPLAGHPWHRMWTAHRQMLDYLREPQATAGVTNNELGCVDAPTWFTWWADKQSEKK